MRILVKNLPNFATEVELRKAFSKQGTITDIYMVKNSLGVFRRIAFIGYVNDKEAEAAIKYWNNAYFKNHKISVDVAREDNSVEEEESDKRIIRYHSKLLVKNLPPGATKVQVEEYFGMYGKVKTVEIIDYGCKVSSVVSFSDSESALKAYKEAKTFQGTRLKIYGHAGKDKKDLSGYYNTLFFSFDLVVKRTCELEKINQKDLINVQDKELGPRVSLMETHLVKQTKKFLEHNKIYLNSLTGEKSKTQLIIRSVDIMTAISLVKEKFKLELAPSKCLAILKFDDAKSALNCYRTVNLRRVKDTLVYCEFLPLSVAQKDEAKKDSFVDEVFSKERNGQHGRAFNTQDGSSEKKQGNTEGILGGVRVSDDTATSNEKQFKKCKLLIRNVPFQATKEDILSIFQAYRKVVDLRLPQKADGGHRGFCFLTFGTYTDLVDVVDYFGTSTHLFGRRLVLEIAKS